MGEYRKMIILAGKWRLHIRKISCFQFVFAMCLDVLMWLHGFIFACFLCFQYFRRESQLNAEIIMYSNACLSMDTTENASEQNRHHVINDAVNNTYQSVEMVKKERFITEIYKREPIWNKADRRHKDTTLVNALYEEVGHIFSLNREDTKKYWKNLLDQFRRHLKTERLHPTRSAGKGHVVCKWPFYKQMMFVAPCIENRNTSSNLVRCTEVVDYQPPSPVIGSSSSTMSFQSKDVIDPNSDILSTSSDITNSDSLYTQGCDSPTSPAPLNTPRPRNRRSLRRHEGIHEFVLFLDRLKE